MTVLAVLVLAFIAVVQTVRAWWFRRQAAEWRSSYRLAIRLWHESVKAWQDAAIAWQIAAQKASAELAQAGVGTNETPTARTKAVH